MKNLLANCVGFEWDEWNSDKNWIRHRVSKSECEEVFFNKPLIVREDVKYSTEKENRYYALGRTDSNRFLFISYTIRDKLIRVISARDMNQKEQRRYDEQIKRYSKI
jgi:uncharacterized DUF497 family protein